MTTQSRLESAPTGPVECLGRTFPSDDARREHYKLLLAEKLKDPAFRSTPGFPEGTDEAILRMSDPPYYTACPNPFLAEFVSFHGCSQDADEEYSCTPLAVDVSVGKTDPLYKAHGYHTKVPHLAIVPSILHYTKPGDLVLDGFCGSGMTGVAAQWCGSASAEYRRKLSAQWAQEGLEPPQWGARKVVLSDLGPAATFIAANFNLPFDLGEFSEAAQRILDQVEDEFGWMYETLHSDGETKGKINYTVWSEVLVCRNCGTEAVFLQEALDPTTKRISKTIECPGCGANASKEQMDLAFESFFDQPRGTIARRPRRVPVLLNYNVGKLRFEKAPDPSDLTVLDRIARLPWPAEVPAVDLPDCQMTRVGRMRTTQTTAVSHMFLPRQAHSLAALWRKATATEGRTRHMLLFFVEQAVWGMSILNRYQPIQQGRPGGSQVNRQLSGVYYVGSHIAEVSPTYNLTLRLGRLQKHAFPRAFSTREAACVATADCGTLGIEDTSVDYIFTDPPFGENIYYADLNFLVESWHGVYTNSEPEAIVDRARKKDTTHYQRLMRKCFEEYHRVLKPGRWMTVVFSNSKNTIWRTIQEAIGAAGFVVAAVRTLDKKQGSFRQVTSSAVKQDLVISAYKPTEALAEQFRLGTAELEHVWSFIDEHLRNLPVFVTADDGADTIAERTPQMLHDRMIAFFVQRDVAVPISGPEFLAGIEQRYAKRDGMYFLREQIPEYDRKRTAVTEVRQLELFVFDEASATHWVRRELQKKPQSFQDLQPRFMQQAQTSWARHEKTIELRLLLEQNFLCYEGTSPVPSQIHGYLSNAYRDMRGLDKNDDRLRQRALDRWYVPNPAKMGDLEKVRNRALLKEFGEYRATKKKRIRQLRTEAVRAGFKDCHDRGDFQTILDVGAKLPPNVLGEDEKLVMYYDVAATRLRR